MRDRGLLFPAFACALWLAAAGLMVAPLQAGVAAGLEPGSIESGDPLGRAIGSFKEAIGDLAFMKADIYFHGGGRYLASEGRADHETAHEHEAVGEHEQHEHGHDADHDTDHEANHEAGSASARDWVSSVKLQVAPAEHREAQGGQLAEMIPFLAAASKLDPHHVTALLTTAYWLDSHLDRTDEAITLLERGRRDNPLSWQMDAALGEIYLKKHSDPVLASESLQSAVKKMEVATAEPFERRKTWLLLAEAFENSGQLKKSLTAYRQALKLFTPADSKTAIDRVRSKVASLDAQLSD
jgi:predicted Zn-dependent protease